MNKNSNNSVFNSSDNENKIEVLFWKVFKNIVLFRNITNNFKSSRVLSYYNLYRVDDMIKNGHFNLLIDKVNRNQCLVLWDVGAKEENNKHLWYIKIFLNIRNNGQFYKNLFTNYNRFIIDNQQITLHTIRSGNVSALKVYLENHYKISEYWFYVNHQIIDLLLETVKYARLSEFIYLYNHFQIGKRNELKNEFISQFKYEGTVDKNRLNKIPIFINYLYGLFGDEIKLKLVKYLPHIRYKIDQISLNDLFHVCETQIIFKDNYLQFQELDDKIATCETNDEKESREIYKKYLKRDHYISDEDIQLSSTIIHEIDNNLPNSIKNLPDLILIQNQFSNDQLKSNKTIEELLIDGKYKCDNFILIEMLLQFYYSNFEINDTFDGFKYTMTFSLLGQYIYYNGNNIYPNYIVIQCFENGISNEILSNKHLIKGFGDIFDRIYFAILVYNIKNGKYPMILFKFCNGDNEDDRMKRIQFIKKICGYIISNKDGEMKIFKKSLVIKIFILLVLYDDVELMDFAIQELYHGKVYLDYYSDNYGPIYTTFYNLHRFIKSIKMLEFCWNNPFFKKSFKKKKNIIGFWCCFGRVDLLNSFGNLIGCDNKHLLKPLCTYYLLKNTDKDILKTTAHILSKPNHTLYDTSRFFEEDYGYSKLSRSNIKYCKFIISHLVKHGKYKVNIISYNENMVHSSIIEILDWIFKNQDSIPLDIIKIHYRLSALVLTGKLDQSNFIVPLKRIKAEKEIEGLIHLAIYYNYFELLDQLFQYYFINEESTFTYFKFMIDNIIYLNCVEILEYIYYYHYSYLIPYIETNYIIYWSIYYDQLDCTIFIVDKMDFQLLYEHFKTVFKDSKKLIQNSVYNYYRNSLL